MPDQSFDIPDARSFFQSLKEEVAQFHQNQTSARLAINCALWSWNLTEWIYGEFKKQLASQYPKLIDFQNSLTAQCPSLLVMQDVGNGSKHFKITKYTPRVTGTTHHKGAFSSGFSRDFDISNLSLQMCDGSKRYFEDELDTVIAFWSAHPFLQP